MNELVLDLLMVFGVTPETMDRLYALQDRGAIMETRGIEAWFSEDHKEEMTEAMWVKARGGVFGYPPLPRPPQLVVQGIGTPPDAFMTNGSLTYVSARLRAALDLAPGTVEYLEVDDSLSDPEVRAAGFSILQVIRYEAAADEARSQRITWDEVMGPGTEAFHPAWPAPWTSVRLRADFTPQAELFWIAGSTEGPYAVPALAERLAERLAGFPDVELRDPELLLAE